MPSQDNPTTIKVLITGFGPFLDITTNPSWEIVKALPSTLSSTNNTPISLIIPNAPIPAAYHKLLAESSSLIAKHEPHVVLHMGLAVDRDYFAIEQSALKEGYHDIPDVDRRVITRVENKKLFGKAPASLATSLDLESVVAAWQTACAGLGFPLRGEGSSKGRGNGKSRQEKRKVDVRLSDDVGTYVCGLIYFSSLVEMQKRTGTRDVVFFHVPQLTGSGEVDVGIEATKELVVALVDAWEART
ncbi:peptidase C15, pyroglutamyl peptidase I-like protein [Karstenula rhodostoma CBS 690.94]|uniref:Peptidase C15, pyroglutamyl peptidase I-like protein n=1 Tax=Karstenula rhodostoma CBS 690.94 TaxID=1392251 RepID=A0A9P4P937_9PLEO|nr:peptidase C15, pyroglutamyl peptidase I-like protein [Karstenula rhodostoma CBS 690.94]